MISILKMLFRTVCSIICTKKPDFFKYPFHILHEYCGKRLISVEFKNSEGQKITAGVGSPYVYRFTPQSPEVLTIVYGKVEVTVNGEKKNSTIGEEIFIPANSELKIVADAYFVYICEYPEDSLDEEQ